MRNVGVDFRYIRGGSFLFFVSLLWLLCLHGGYRGAFTSATAFFLSTFFFLFLAVCLSGGSVGLGLTRFD